MEHVKLTSNISYSTSHQQSMNPHEAVKIKNFLLRMRTVLVWEQKFSFTIKQPNKSKKWL